MTDITQHFLYFPFMSYASEHSIHPIPNSTSTTFKFINNHVNAIYRNNKAKILLPIFSQYYLNLLIMFFRMGTHQVLHGFRTCVDPLAPPTSKTSISKPTSSTISISRTFSFPIYQPSTCSHGPFTPFIVVIIPPSPTSSSAYTSSPTCVPSSLSHLQTHLVEEN
jgi:hypothetical protein